MTIYSLFPNRDNRYFARLNRLSVDVYRVIVDLTCAVQVFGAIVEPISYLSTIVVTLKRKWELLSFVLVWHNKSLIK